MWRVGVLLMGVVAVFAVACGGSAGAPDGPPTVELSNSTAPTATSLGSPAVGTVPPPTPTSSQDASTQAPTATAGSNPTQPGPTQAPTPYGAVEVTVIARDLEFEPASISIPPHVTVTLTLDNQDVGIAHDVWVTVVGGGRTDACTGPCTASFEFGAHETGTYQFFCNLHPGMDGDLVVQ